jgi:hypothetical protein
MRGGDAKTICSAGGLSEGCSFFGYWVLFLEEDEFFAERRRVGCLDSGILRQ